MVLSISLRQVSFLCDRDRTETDVLPRTRVTVPTTTKELLQLLLQSRWGPTDGTPRYETSPRVELRGMERKKVIIITLRFIKTNINTGVT